MAVRPSTQQIIDRIVGTAAIVGLSIAAIRWLSHASKERRRKESLSWWWPVIALRRRNERRARSQCGEERRVELEQCEAREKNMESGYEHRGSCHCRSIQFLLRGPQHLHSIDSPGKIRYPHIPTTAIQFQLLRGETHMNFYYVDDKTTDSSIAGSTIASEEPQYNFENDNDLHNNRTQQQSSGAHGFCANCGVHILRAPSRSSEDLEINANCLEDGAVATRAKDKGLAALQRSSTSSLTSSGIECERDNKASLDQPKIRSSIETVNENEALLGGSASFWENLDDRPAPPEPYVSKLVATETRERGDSINDGQPLTQSITESDDYSMESSFTATSSLHMLSVASGNAGGHSSNNRNGLPPLPPSSGMSAKTLPPRFRQSQRTGFGGGRSVGAGLNSNWSIASAESNDLDADMDKPNVVSPKMMNQMKYYMSRHMAKEKS